MLGETDKTVIVKFFLGEQDGMQFDLPADWDMTAPPQVAWVLTPKGERKLAEYRVEPPGLRARLTTCAYKFVDVSVDEDGEIDALCYERDVLADITPESAQG